jgi:hypothetical protein
MHVGRHLAEQPQPALTGGWLPHRILARHSRFSMRTLLAAMAVCCLVMGVWSIYVQPYREQAASSKKLAELGVETVSVGATGPAWQRWLVETMVGEKEFVHVIRADLRSHPQATTAIQSLAGLRRLKELYLDRCEIDAERAKLIGSFRELETLSLSYAGLDDDELAHLAPLTNLQVLFLTGNKVTGASAPVIKSMPALRELYVRWTPFTQEDVTHLRASMPNCRVYHHQLPD